MRSAPRTRSTSGLKLLNTVLPLSEAVVFRCDDTDALQTVARYKGPAPNRTGSTPEFRLARRHQALSTAAASGKLGSQTTSGQNSSTVAVPLLHENETAGVLLIRLASEFSADDTPLLEAVGSQFARNLERESFTQNPARTQSLSFFSQSGSKRKIDALNVLKAVTVEQRCEASTLAHIDDGVAIAYLDGTLALVNPTLAEFCRTHFRASRRKWISSTCLTNSARTFLTNLRSLYDECCKPVTSTKANSTSNRRTRFSTFGFHFFVSDNRRRNEPIGIALYVKDLTATKEYEKLKSDMISLMSHELRTPLTSINGFAELLTADETIPPQAREFVSIIANESQRMSRMINTFLSVTQLQRKDKQEVLKIPLRLDEVVRETIASLQPVAKKKRHSPDRTTSTSHSSSGRRQEPDHSGREEPREQRDQVQSRAHDGHCFNGARS